MTTPTEGPSPLKPPDKPSGPSPKPIKPAKDKKDEYLLKSPFAKMFERTGATPTVKEMRAIINGILKTEIDQIKKQDAGWKKAMKRLKEAIEGTR